LPLALADPPKDFHQRLMLRNKNILRERWDHAVETELLAAVVGFR
jgi:hypothetical protein